MTALKSRREELELQVFKDIEAKESDSKLYWASAKKVTQGLLSSVSPPPMATDSEGNVETDPIAVLRV